ncbi:MAG: hypothetical protein FLDDKLPJ_00169 [Phycisphaerae bacterium]|nr:hypothetical protein [Phycisphaerae bacterium]
MLARILNPPSKQNAPWVPIWRQVAQSRTQSYFDANSTKLIPYLIDVRDLLRQVLLYVPRLDPNNRDYRNQVDREIDRLAKSLVDGRKSVAQTISFPPLGCINLDSLSLFPISPSVTNQILAHYHYLRHPRDIVYSLGLFSAESPHVPAALLTFSQLDLPHIERLLPDGISRDEALVLSRVYASPTAPDNAISYALRLARAWLQGHDDRSKRVRFLLTYVNPNLGFDASSLRASGWSVFCKETRHYYLYHEQAYITDRACVQRFHSDSFAVLNSRYPRQFSRSKVELEPLHIYSSPVLPKDRKRASLCTFPERIIAPESPRTYPKTREL